MIFFGDGQVCFSVADEFRTNVRALESARQSETFRHLASASREFMYMVVIVMSSSTSTNLKQDDFPTLPLFKNGAENATKITRIFNPINC